MSERDDRLLIVDILDAAKKINEYCSGYTYEEFLDDDRTIDAVIRNFEVIGEAAGRIHPDTKAANPNVEWRDISDFRNRLIHEYFGVDHQVIWRIIENNLNELIQDLEGML